jgi:N-formylglutamate deformylase
MAPRDREAAPAAFEIVRPARGPLRPVLFGAAHGGDEFPDGRSVAGREAALARGGWDAHVCELLANVPLAGATTLCARFARDYLDVDLTEREVEEGMRAAQAPAEEVERRLRQYYRPYREALRDLLEELRDGYDDVWYLEVRAVPSRGRRGEVDAGQLRPDVVVSDRMGTAADPDLTARIIEWFDALGFRVQMNDPFRGGDLIGAFGNPRAGRQCVQLAFNRALFLNERTLEPTTGFPGLRHTVTTFAHELMRWRGPRLVG